VYNGSRTFEVSVSVSAPNVIMADVKGAVRDGLSHALGTGRRNRGWGRTFL